MNGTCRLRALVEHVVDALARGALAREPAGLDEAPEVPTTAGARRVSTLVRARAAIVPRVTSRTCASVERGIERELSRLGVRVRAGHAERVAVRRHAEHELVERDASGVPSGDG
jgi:hypothetical protein